MLHYTVNTANIFDCRQKPFDPRALATLQPIVRLAIAQGRIQAPLPGAFSQYSVRVTVDDGAALFDVLDPEGHIMTTNAVAWTKEGESAIWSGFESLYLNLTKQFDLVAVSRYPTCPDSLPWLTTLVLPNESTLLISWLANFEQCLATALIQSARPPRPRGGRGFGKSP